MSANSVHELAVLALIALLALARGDPAHAGCEGEWLFATGQALPGVHGSVYATAVHDDGSGPALYVGGDFDIAGDVSAASIARWDGTHWSALGRGVAGTVSALSVYNGELIAGGQFTSAGDVSANCIARWNGTSWAPLDSGLETAGEPRLGASLALPGRGSSAGVAALAVHDGALIAAGAFSLAGGASANTVARWDGSGWQALGDGVDASAAALAVWNDQLIVGGAFHNSGGLPAQHVASWNGASWSAMGGGTPGNVYALAIWGTDLIAGGRSVPAGRALAARWDGAAWVTLGEGLGGPNACVRSLTSYGDWLIAGGVFDHSGATELNGIAAWDGQAWGPIAEPWAVSSVNTLGVWGDELIVGGDSQIGAGLVRWDGSRWDCISGAGQIWGGPVDAFTEYNGDLIAGGRLMLGGSLSRSIARFDGTRWQALAPGLTGETDDSAYALTAYQDGLIAGGTFRWAGDLEVDYVARWDGAAWSAMGDGFDSYVNALAVYHGELIAGGWFQNSGLTPTPHLARWTGTAWEPLGGGTDGEVHVLCVWADSLYVGGRFSLAGDVAANCIARWDGTTFHRLGSGMDFRVLALAGYQSRLVAGGSFHRAGGLQVTGIASWDGSAWSAMGTGPVMELALYQDQLWGCTGVSTVRDAVDFQLTRWNGTDWVLQPGVLDGSIAALGVWNETLVVGGSFLTIGGRIAPLWVRRVCPFDYGDLNCDMAVDVFDINPFLLALTDVPAYQAQYPGCDPMLADINHDGAVNAFDIDPFVLLLTGG